MKDLILLAPELVLVVVTLALTLAARHVHRAQSAATWVVVAAAAAVYSVWAFSEGPTIGFGGTIVGDAYGRFFNVLLLRTLPWPRSSQ